MPPSNVNAAHCRTEALYLSHHTWLLGWLYRRLGCSDTSADLAHDTFLRLLRKSDAPNIKEPRAYLSTVAHGLVVNHWRRKDIEKAYLKALAARPEPLAPSPEERELVIEALKAAVAILDGLPQRAREIFMLSQMDGLTYPQIAQRLGITVNIVQKDMIKAMSRCYLAVYG